MDGKDGSGAVPRGPAARAALAVAVTIAALICAAAARAAIVWLPAVDISSSSVYVDVPRLAIDGAGDEVAVWYQTVGKFDVIMSATRPAGGGWSSPVEVARGDSAYGPQVGLDAHGDATVVWYQYDGTEDVVEAATRPAGGAWSAPQQLSVALVPGANADEPVVAVNAGGGAVAAWYQAVGPIHAIMSARRPAGGPWSAPAQLSAGDADAYGPQVALDSSGSATAVWYAYMAGQSKGLVQAATLPAGGVWSMPADLSSASDDSSEPQVAADPGGDVTAVWASYDGSTDLIESAGRLGGGAWSAAQRISGTGDADGPMVAIDGTGAASAVWDSFDGTNFVVDSARAPRGGAWSSPTMLSAPSSDAGEPQVAADGAGDVAASWYRFNGVGYAIEAARRPAGGSWGTAAQLSGSDAYESQIAVSGPDSATTVWNLSDGHSPVIQASSTGQSPSTGGGGGGTGGNGGGSGTGGGNAPRLTSLRLRPDRFRTVARHGAGATGTTVSYRDSAAATTTLSVLAIPTKTCTRAQRRRRQCVIRGRLIGKFAHHDRAGVNRFHFSGRVGGHALKPGRYRLVASPRTRAGGIGAAREATFRIIR
jgi:hypothetical protein